MQPPTVFPPENDPLKALEDEAYEAAEDVEKKDHGDYSHIGPAVSERPYRAGKLREWPIHTDFRPDELAPGRHD